jgi:hypothetical protein
MKYFIIKYGVKKGPYSISELKRMNLLNTTLVWCDGLEEWKPALEIQELNEITYNPPPPVFKRKAIIQLINTNKRILLFIVFAIYMVWTYYQISSNGADKDSGMLHVLNVFVMLVGVFRLIEVKTAWLLSSIFQIVIMLLMIINNIGDLIIVIPYNLVIISLFYLLYSKTIDEI